MSPLLLVAMLALVLAILGGVLTADRGTKLVAAATGALALIHLLSGRI